MRFPLRPQHLSLAATVGVFCLLFITVSFAYSGFFSWFQFSALLADNASLGLAAIGMTFVILSGGIDLSVGAVIALSSILFAKCVVVWALPWPVAMIVVLCVSCLLGGGMGTIIHQFRLPPFLVTLAGMFLARGCALALTQEKRLSITDESVYSSFSNVSVFGLTLSAVTLLVIWLVALWISNQSRFGRAVYAIGGCEQSAELMGLPVARTKISVYAISGLCAGIAGVIHALGTGAGDASIAFMLELDAIAAVVIGGTLLSGGVGNISGTLIGVLILGIITTVPSYQGNLNSWWTRIFIGGLLLCFIVLQRGLQNLTVGGFGATTLTVSPTPSDD